jgi:dynactin 1
MRNNLNTLSTLCKRFGSTIRYCDADSFLSLARLTPDLLPLEKRLDMHIDLLRRDMFNERECAEDVLKIQAQLDHVEESFFNLSGFEAYGWDLGEREMGWCVGFELDLDMFAAAVGFVRGSLKGLVGDAGNGEEEGVEDDMGGGDIEEELFRPLGKLLELSRSARTLSKYALPPLFFSPDQAN